MRLTVPLSVPRMWIYMRGAAWYKGRKKKITEDPNIERILQSGYNVVDANEYVKPMSPFYKDYDAIPDLPPRFPTPPTNDKSHPDWKDEICKTFDDATFPINGLTQALAFTKGVRMSDNFPESILERVKSLKISKDEDDRAQRAIQQAFIWDSYLEKLPKLMDHDLPFFVPTREYGIPWQRRNDIMISNFIRVIESKVPLDLSQSRMIAPAEEMRVNFKRHGVPVQFKLNALSHLMSTSQMKPMLSKAEVKGTTQLPLTDIFPFWSTANFEDKNIYKSTDNFVVKPSSKFPVIHTSVFSHHIPGSHTHLHPRWDDDRFMGTTILYNFATALLVAKRKYGPTVSGDLPEPITTQVIHLTGKEWQFSVFQLNTLNLEDATPDSIKNGVWITDKMDLFSKVENNLGREIFEGYNPEILKILTAMYLS